MPSHPTGVRIDSSKLAHIHTELVRLTDNWPVEKIERVNNILAKVGPGQTKIADTLVDDSKPDKIQHWPFSY